MRIAMSRRPIHFAIGCLSTVLFAMPVPSASDLGAWANSARASEPGAPLRPEEKDAPSRVLRSGGDDYALPVDRLCNPVDGTGFSDPHVADGPAGVTCANLPISIMTPTGNLVFNKFSTANSITGPGPVDYTYEIINNFGDTITGVMVLDDHVDAPPECPDDFIPNGEVLICTATYTVTPQDIIAGGSPAPGSGFLRNNAIVVSAQGASATTSLSIPYAVQPDPLQLFPSSPSLGTTVIGRPEAYIFSASGGSPPYEFNGTGAPPGMAFQQNGAEFVLSGAPQAAGNFVIGVALSDVQQSTIERNYTLNVVTPLRLLPLSGPLPDAIANQPYLAIFSIVGGQEPYGFSATGLPQGMSVSLVGSQLRLSGTPAQIGDFVIQLTASDSSTPSQFASQTYTLQVAQDLRLSPPDPVLPDAVAGQPYEFLFMIEGGMPPFDVNTGGAPPGLGFTLNDRLLTLSGSASQPGGYTIDIAVTDSGGTPQSVAREYSLRVVPELRLMPSDPELPIAQGGEPYSMTFTTQGGLTPVELSGVDAPPGMAFESVGADLVLSGISDVLGDYVVTVTARDSASPQQLVVREYNLSVLLRLELDPDALPPATEGEDYLVALSVRNGVPPYLIEVTGLPPGLVVSSNAINGQPGQAGDFPVTAFATDAQGNSGSRDYVLQVGSSGDVFIGETLPDAYLGTPYGYQLSAVGAPAPLSWGGASGVPAGLSLVSTGFLNGFPQQVGSFSFTATVTAANGQATTGDFNIAVLPPDLLTIEPQFTPGLVGALYRSPTAVRGGTPPYDCELIDGQLPPGLVLNGCNTGVDGTPAEAGSYAFSLGVMDSGAPGLVSELAGTIQVAENTPIPDPQPPNLDFQEPYKIPVAETSLAGPVPAFPDESLQGLAVDAWGNRYVVGYSYNGLNYDIRVMKYSPRGTLLWDQKYDSGSDDYGYGIAVAEGEQAVYASGYSLVGNRYEAVLVRYDLSGVEQWVVNNGGTSQVVAFYALTTDADRVYAVGERYNGTNFDAVVAGYSHSGNLEWETVRPSQATRTGYAVLRTVCGNTGCLLIGGAQGTGAESGWVEQMAPDSGAASPLATLTGNSVLALRPTASGFIAGGSTPGNDWSVTALTFSGQAQWSQTLSSGHRLRGVDVDRNGYVYAAGSGSGGNDGMLALFSPAGTLIGEYSFDEGAAESFHGMAIGPEGLVTAAGQQTQTGGNRFLIVNFNSGKAP